MSKTKLFQLIMIVAAISGLLIVSGFAEIKKAGKAKAPDLISIDLPADAGSGEMEAVAFQHALHNQAVDGKCEQCHVREDKKLVFKFKRTDQPPTMDLYHENCISCHDEKKADNKTSGPTAAECRSCHGANPESSGPAWKEIRFDKSLHYIHESSSSIASAVKGQEDNCSACHHSANEKSLETYYLKGEEAACIYCHKEAVKNGVRSMQNAAHDSCVACHETLAGQKIKTGPTVCAGCHDPASQAKIEKIKDVPRMKRNQPDAVFMTGLASEGNAPEYFMNPVAFNHKAHESVAESCKTCHHETLKKCSDCHTPKGDAKGNLVRLEEAMHSTRANQSCVACHKKETAAKDCAACHSIMPSSGLDNDSCIVCHNAPDNKVITDEKMQEMLAAEVIEGKADAYKKMDMEKIPEIVVISDLADEYKASEFPHRKVVRAIAERTEKSGLAKAFHKDQQALCMGCHHNSPAAMTPPKCASCHGEVSDVTNGRPSLKAAFHGQCITCHQKMEVKDVAATDCIKCHAKK